MPGQLKDCDERIIETVINAAINVHKEFGPGLLESIYEMALLMELKENGLEAHRQVEISVYYRGRELGTGFRADLIVDNSLLLELKSVENIMPVHISQVITYLKILRFKRGYLLNFNKPRLVDGLKRISI